MTFADLLLFAASSVGMTLIIVHGAIFERLRKFITTASEKYQCLLPIKELVTCVQCSGFWCGLFCGAYFSHDVFFLFLCGCAASGIGVLTDKYLTFLYVITPRQNENR